MFTKEKTNVCKGVGILFLIFHHLFRTVETIQGHGITFYLLGDSQAAQLATALRVCVWIFAFLSAYGLSVKYMGLSENGKPAFVVRQWPSLMGSYWFVFILSVVAYVLLGHNLWAKYDGKLLNLLLDGFAWSDFFHTPLLIGVYWYMCFAQFQLLVVPALHLICKKLGYLTIPLTFLLMQLVSAGISSPYGGDYLNYLPVTVAGVLFAQKDLLNRLAVRRRTLPRCICEGIVLLLIAAVSLYWQENLRAIDAWRLRSLLYMVAAVSVCIWGGLTMRGKVWEKTLGFLGKYSGDMFLIHVFLMAYTPGIVYISSSWILVYLAVVAESLVLGMLIEKLKEWTRYSLLIKKASESAGKWALPVKKNTAAPM